MGHRIIDKSIVNTLTNTNISNTYDNDMTQLQEYLRIKHQKLQQINVYKSSSNNFRFTAQLLSLCYIR